MLRLFRRLPRLLLAGALVLGTGMSGTGWAESPPQNTATERHLRENGAWEGKLDPRAQINRPGAHYFLQGATHLHAAARVGDLTAAEWLLDNGANMEARDRAGFTPLLLAVGEGRSGMVEFLTGRGANANAWAGIRISALHIAAGRGDIAAAEILLAAGAALNAKTNRGDTPANFAILFKRPEMAKWLKERGGKMRRKKH